MKKEGEKFWEERDQIMKKRQMQHFEEQALEEKRKENHLY